MAATLTALVPTTATDKTATASTTTSSAGVKVSSKPTTEKLSTTNATTSTVSASETTTSKSKSVFAISKTSKNKDAAENKSEESAKTPTGSKSTTNSWGKDRGGGGDKGYDEEGEEEEEGYEEGDEDGWEWDEGETWDEEGVVKDNGDDNDDDDNDDDKSTYAADTDNEQAVVPTKPLKSLNPLPPEMINTNYEHEKSVERTNTTDEAETGASSNADVEDNDIDERHFITDNGDDGAGADKQAHWTAASRKSLLINMPQLAPLHLDSTNLDPRMEALCKGIKLLSTSPRVENGNGVDMEVVEEEIDEEDELEHEDRMARLRNEWTARTLISLAPRYLLHVLQYRYQFQNKNILVCY